MARKAAVDAVISKKFHDSVGRVALGNMVISRRTRSQRAAAYRAYQVASCSGLRVGGLKTTNAPVELRCTNWASAMLCVRS